MVAVPAAQPEVGSNPFPSRSSVPVKVVQYNNFTNGHGGSGSQFSQPVCTIGISKFICRLLYDTIYVYSTVFV